MGEGQSLAGQGSEAAPITVRAAGDGPVIFEGRVEAKPSLEQVEGTDVYVCAETGPVAAVAVDLADSRWGVDDLPAVPDRAQLAQAYQGYVLDAAAGRMYLKYRGGESLAGHTVHVLRDPAGLTIAGEYLRVEGFTVRHFAGGGDLDRPRPPRDPQRLRGEPLRLRLVGGRRGLARQRRARGELPALPRPQRAHRAGDRRVALRTQHGLSHPRARGLPDRRGRGRP